VDIPAPSRQNVYGEPSLMLPSRSDERATLRQLIGFLLTWAVTSLAILAGVEAEIRRHSQHKTFVFSIIVAFVLQLALYWLPGFASVRAWFEARLSRRGRALAAGAALLVPYVVYGSGTGAWTALSFLKLLAIAASALGIYALAPVNSRKLGWQDLAVMLIVAVPVYIGFHRYIWTAPVYLDVMARLFSVSLAAFAVLSVRPLADVGYAWRLEIGDWTEGLKQLAFFAVIGVPLGFLLHFIGWHPRREGITAVALSFAGFFLFIAVAEELFFRGMLQNLLEKSVANKYMARGIASVIFGLSHINHGFPNWRYVIMASIAGWFYGTAWHNRRSIVSASVTHAMVDTLWRHFLLL
jgi:membrane protease YdiL (CAAX protease family)